MGEFTLEIKEGEFTDSEIVVMLGENGEFAPGCLYNTNLNGLSSCCIDDSPALLCLQAQGKPLLSGCWPDPSDPMEEVRVYRTWG